MFPLPPPFRDGLWRVGTLAFPRGTAVPGGLSAPLLLLCSVVCTSGLEAAAPALASSQPGRKGKEGVEEVL